MPASAPRLLNMLLSGFIVVSSIATAQTPSSPPTGSSTAAKKTDAPLTQAEIEQLLAPIALYPDALLAQIFMASTYPLEVVEAARWQKANPKVTGTALEDAMQKQSWDASVKSLTAFPQVLQMMNEKLSWTQQLGDAFLADQKRVMAAAQKLRKAANDQGNLKSSKEQNVVVEQVSGETIIKIEPADPQVVYVPAYNPSVVYGAWPYAAYPPYYYYPPGYAPGAAFWTFTAGVIVGSALWGGCHWGSSGGGVYINHNNYNNFNRTNIKGDGNWNHNAEHRKGVAYKDKGVAQKYNGANAGTRDAQRDQFRGNAESGRADLGQNVDKGNRPSTSDRSASSRDASRGESGRDSSNSNRPSTSDNSTRVSSNDASRGNGSRDASGGRQASSFGGADSGRQANDFGSRGQSSRQSTGGGGGGRGGGGGGRGGGGRR
jgi:uncharacterized membrane protein YgcG